MTGKMQLRGILKEVTRRSRRGSFVYVSILNTFSGGGDGMEGKRGASGGVMGSRGERGMAVGVAGSG